MTPRPVAAGYIRVAAANIVDVDLLTISVKVRNRADMHCSDR